MPKKLGRRTVLRTFVKGAMASLLGLAASRQTQKGDDASALETCFWQYQYSVCQGGVLLQKWCFKCCAGIDCEVFYCEFREVGSC